MALTIDQIRTLRNDLINIETSRILSETKRNDISDILTKLTTEDLDNILKSVNGSRSSKIDETIGVRLSDDAMIKATTRVDGYIANNSFPINFVYRIINL